MNDGKPTRPENLGLIETLLSGPEDRELSASELVRLEAFLAMPQNHVTLSLQAEARGDTPRVVELPLLKLRRIREFNRQLQSQGSAGPVHWEGGGAVSFVSSARDALRILDKYSVSATDNAGRVLPPEYHNVLAESLGKLIKARHGLEPELSHEERAAYRLLSNAMNNPEETQFIVTTYGQAIFPFARVAPELGYDPARFERTAAALKALAGMRDAEKAVGQTAEVNETAPPDPYADSTTWPEKYKSDWRKELGIPSAKTFNRRLEALSIRWTDGANKQRLRIHPDDIDALRQ